MQDHSLKPPASNRRSDPYYQAQDILSRRDHAEGEVRRKLAGKGFADNVIEEVVAWLYQKNLLNDEVFARRYAESILLQKPVGPRWVKLKLKQRGVSEQIIATTVTDVFAGDWQQGELIKQAVETWLRQHKKFGQDKERLWRFLASRGFDPERISSYLESLS